MSRAQRMHFLHDVFHMTAIAFVSVINHYNVNKFVHKLARILLTVVVLNQSTHTSQSVSMRKHQCLPEPPSLLLIAQKNSSAHPMLLKLKPKEKWTMKNKFDDKWQKWLVAVGGGMRTCCSFWTTLRDCVSIFKCLNESFNFTLARCLFIFFYFFFVFSFF